LFRLVTEQAPKNKINVEMNSPPPLQYTFDVTNNTFAYCSGTPVVGGGLMSYY